MRTKSVEVRPPAWRWRVVVTVVLLLVTTVANQAYNAVAGGIEGELAVKQLSGDPTERAIGRAVAQSNLPAVAWGAAWVLIACVWVPFAYGHIRYELAKEDGETES